MSGCGFGKILSAIFVLTTSLVLQEGKSDNKREQAGFDWEKRDCRAGLAGRLLALVAPVHHHQHEKEGDQSWSSLPLRTPGVHSGVRYQRTKPNRLHETIVSNTAISSHWRGNL